MIDDSITLNSTEFERIKTELIQLDADLARLLAQPAVYATVVRAERNDNGINVGIAFDGKLLEVHGSPGMTFKPSDNVEIDLETRQIRF